MIGYTLKSLQLNKRTQTVSTKLSYNSNTHSNYYSTVYRIRHPTSGSQNKKEKHATQTCKPHLEAVVHEFVERSDVLLVVRLDSKPALGHHHVPRVSYDHHHPVEIRA